MLSKTIFLGFLIFVKVSTARAQVEPNAPAADTAQTHSPVRKFLLPGALIAYGYIAVNVKDLSGLDKLIEKPIARKAGIFGQVEDYLRWAPAALVYASDLAGIKAKNNVYDQTVLLVMSTALVSASVSITKDAVGRPRPNLSNNRSFPSSHTATAFMAAEFLRQEYKDVSRWFTVAGYTTAIFVGLLRLNNRAHWFSDIVAGAGYGIMGVKISYFVYRRLKKLIFPRSSRATVLAMPTLVNSKPGFQLALNF